MVGVRTMMDETAADTGLLTLTQARSAQRHNGAEFRQLLDLSTLPPANTSDGITTADHWVP